MLTVLAAAVVMTAPLQETPAAKQVSEAGIRHGVLCTGAETFLLDGEGRTIWSYPRNTREGWLLPNGHFLLVISRCPDYPSGGVVETDRTGRVYFEFKGGQSEVDTVQPLADGHILVTESGPSPRLMEIDRGGRTVLEFPLVCQTKDFHMQTRMARKLPNGHYLVPHLLDFAVKEYDRKGRVVWEGKTPNWPFAAVRLKNGRTVVSCTRGNVIVELDREGRTVWQVSNEDLPEKPIRDACGLQVLPNGNVVVTSYGAGDASAPKLIEIDRSKKIVWTLYTGRAHGVHTFQIVNPGGTAGRERPQR